MCLFVLLQQDHSASRAQGDRQPRVALPSVVCAIADARLTCYEPRRATPTRISPDDQQVLDFAMAPGGDWLVYRTLDALYMAKIGGQPRVIDQAAAPSALIPPDLQTLAWAPDGLGLAYITPLGLKTAYPGDKFAVNGDRPYLNLKWSTDGGRLAARATDGSWVFFESKPGALKVTRTFDQDSDAAWLDESAVVIAPTVGGLLRLNAAQANSAPDWFIADETFIKLQSGTAGQVLALHPDRGTKIGGAVSIQADGKWTPFGNAKLDTRLDWGPAPGELLYFITGGTPITVDRTSGAEDALPLRRVTRIAFGGQPLPEVVGVQLDADLYFLAADANGILQLYRLPGFGFPLISITRSFASITGYSVIGDKVEYIVNGARVLVNSDGSIPEVATPEVDRPTRTPLPPPRPTVTVRVQSIGWQPGPSVVQRVGSDGTPGAPTLFENAINSPSGRYAAGTRGTAAGQLIILDWTTGKQVAIESVIGATAIRWVP